MTIIETLRNYFKESRKYLTITFKRELRLRRAIKMNITRLTTSTFDGFLEEPAFAPSTFGDFSNLYVFAIWFTFPPIFTPCACNQQFSCVEERYLCHNVETRMHSLYKILIRQVKLWEWPVSYCEMHSTTVLLSIYLYIYRTSLMF